MSFADLKPQMERLPHAEMVQAMAFLKSRLRADIFTWRERSHPPSRAASAG